jgi:exoribonuclease R
VTVDTTVLRGLLMHVAERRVIQSQTRCAASWTTNKLTESTPSTSARRREAGEATRGASAKWMLKSSSAISRRWGRSRTC